MAKIKLTKPEMATFNGYMGRVKFAKGVSVEDVSQADARLLGALTHVAWEDSGEQTGANAQYQKARSGKASVEPERRLTAVGVDGKPLDEIRPQDVTYAPKQPEKDDELEGLEKGLDEDEADIVEVEAEAESVPSANYTRAQLEELADVEGIRGLRQVADPMGVKDTSISGLIKEILHTQDNPKVKT